MRASSDTIPAGDAQPCPGTPTVTDIDGNVYNTVKIGEQCWMKENLRVTHYADGVAIPAGGSNSSATDPYFYIYPNLDAATYGYYYNWAAAMHGAASSYTNPSNVQGVCPTGWHLPSYPEWIQLTDYVGSKSEYFCDGNSNYIAKALSSSEGWNSSNGECYPGDQSVYANNATGFSVVPAGWFTGATPGGAGSDAPFFSCTQTGADNAFWCRLFYDSPSLTWWGNNKGHGRSVRCLLGAGCSPTSSEFSDTICSGDSYTWNGQTYSESGDYTQTFSTVNGCDSVVTLHLTITDCAPSCDAFAVRILGDTAGCATDSVTLYAMVPGATPPVAVGDILCTDNTIVKPGDWPVAGKAALGVVFHVDGTGLHGWAVHLNDQSTSITWGGYGTDIPGLSNYNISRGALADTAGYANTLAIRTFGDASTYPAAWAVDLDNGWYLPAAGQLRALYGELPTLNTSLLTAGGTQFPMSGLWYYWSSTEYNSISAWNLRCFGILDNINKGDGFRMRSVRTF
ncbi:MAG: fibrobacter succinogenes major paralogous domain-containing protein [Bacteroidales bacterium]|nr:fibrobacter succinogenes major paralogous domain-containing protein [Bacteroidales bacterium]